jgi:hypothetical protein
MKRAIRVRITLFLRPCGLAARPLKSGAARGQSAMSREVLGFQGRPDGPDVPALRPAFVEQKLPSVNNLRIAASLAALFLDASGGMARAQVNISPQALAHRAYCIEQAEQNDLVFVGAYVIRGERGITYRCRDEVAVAYFNDLGRRRKRSEDRVESNETGVYVLRPIFGVGYCWHKTEDERRLPVSFWGCDVYVAY